MKFLMHIKVYIFLKKLIDLLETSNKYLYELALSSVNVNDRI